nr:protein FAM228A-like isoform X2 [Pogona vitticeps]
MPITSYQTPTGVLRQESSDLQWLIRLRCPRTQMEQIPHLKQCLPAASSSLSRSPSKTCQSSPSERAKTSESWLTPKHFSVVQAIVNESQDICSTLSLLERENCFVRGNAFLESYTPSVYDPFFLKTCTDIWKASIPPLNDPLLKEIQERYFEAGIIKQCDTGKIYSSKEINELQKVELPLLPLSRQLMNPVEWLKIPPGYMESEIRQKSRQKMVPTRNMSSMDFKNWNDSSLLQPNKRCTSARKQDFVCLPSFLKKTRTGSSVCKPAIKFAS